MPVLPKNPFWFSCDEMYDGRSGKVWSLEGERSYVRKFKVVVKVKYLGPVGVCLCPALPLAASAYHLPNPSGGPPLEFDLLALMLNMSADQQDSGDWGVWIVTCEYGTNIPMGNRPENLSANAQANANSPDSRIAEIGWDFETTQEARQRDLYGAPYMDTASIPLKAVTTPIDYPVLRITRNELTYNYAKASYYTRGVNDKKFLGAPAGIVQCMPPKSEQADRGNLRYWRTSYQLRFRAPQQDGGYILPKINVIRPVWRIVETGAISPVSNPAETKDKLIFDHWVPFPNSVDEVDTWQPLKLMAGTSRLGRAGDEGDFLMNLVGKPVAIRELVGGAKITEPVNLDFSGQRAVAVNPLVDPAVPQYFKRFYEFRQVDLHLLLVRGLS